MKQTRKQRRALVRAADKHFGKGKGPELVPCLLDDKGNLIRIIDSKQESEFLKLNPWKEME
jgi:hypothetical protein